MEVIIEYTILPLFLKTIPKATNENMVTDLIIEGDKPAINPKNHNNRSIKISLLILPYRKYSRGLKMKFNRNKIIPICKPEIARM